MKNGVRERARFLVGSVWFSSYVGSRKISR